MTIITRFHILQPTNNTEEAPPIHETLRTSEVLYKSSSLQVLHLPISEKDLSQSHLPHLIEVGIWTHYLRSSFTTTMCILLPVLLLISCTIATILENGQPRLDPYPGQARLLKHGVDEEHWKTYGADAEEISYKGRWDEQHISCQSVIFAGLDPVNGHRVVVSPPFPFVDCPS
jgi:hypothetical protein